MEKDGLIENIQDCLDEKRDARTLKQVDRFDHKLTKLFKKVKDTRSVDLILGAEKVVLLEIQQHHLHGDGIKASNSKALDDIKFAQKTLEKVYSAETYLCVIEEHGAKDKSVEGRPKDQTVMFINSHKTRIDNQRRAVNRPAYLGFLNTRYQCIATAGKEYEKLQDKMLVQTGKKQEPEVKKSKDKGMER